MKRWWARSVCATLVVAACSGGEAERPPVPTVPPTQQGGPATVAPQTRPELRLSVVDEDGAPISAVTATLIGRDRPLEFDGTLSLDLDQPVAGVVEADGYLSEVVVLSPDEPTSTVEMLRRSGDDGATRLSMTFGGDVMMARRFQDPTERTDTPVVTDNDSARDVVARVAPIAAASDVTIVNLESVIGDLDASEAAPGRSSPLQSPRSLTAALREMGVDAVTRGNERAYDFGEAGVAATTVALSAGGIASAGSGIDQASATQPALLEAGPTTVGLLAYTTITGDAVNDELPRPQSTPPQNLPESERWMYEAITFGFGQVGDAAYIAPIPRLPSELWAAFEDVEDTLDEATVAQLWAAITSTDAVPELQDYVARRGHGGAAAFDRSTIEEDIDGARTAGAELVVVQLHGGLQNSDAPTNLIREAAHVAIDKGADLVVIHHSHVPQGFEWYEGKLIAYSLGNLVYDQLATANSPSLLLRTVYEGQQLVRATVVPLTIDRYQPVVLAGAGARDVLQLLDERSALQMSAARDVEGFASLTPDSSAITNASVTTDSAIGTVVTGRATEERSVAVGDSGVVSISDCAVARVDDTELEFAVDLLRWGSFDNVTADGSADGPLHWNRSGVVTMGGDGREDAYVSLVAERTSGAFVRPSGRVALPRHRRRGEGDVPLDSAPSYTLDVLVRRSSGSETPSLRVAVYPDAGEDDPELDNEVLAETTLTLTGLRRDWTEASFDLTALFTGEVNGQRPAGAMLYVDNPPGPSQLDIDDARVLEWRSYTFEMVGSWVPVDAIRATPGDTVRLTLSGCSES